MLSAQYCCRCNKKKRKTQKVNFLQWDGKHLQSPGTLSFRNQAGGHEKKKNKHFLTPFLSQIWQRYLWVPNRYYPSWKVHAGTCPLPSNIPLALKRVTSLPLGSFLFKNNTCNSCQDCNNPSQSATSSLGSSVVSIQMPI